jgi:hypothetical protein
MVVDKLKHSVCEAHEWIGKGCCSLGNEITMQGGKCGSGATNGRLLTNQSVESVWPTRELGGVIVRWGCDNKMKE